MAERVTIELPRAEDCGPIKLNSRAQIDRQIDSKIARLLGFKRKPLPKIEAMGRTIIYIYNVTERTFPTWRIPGFPHYTIAPCEAGKQFSEPIEIKELYFEEYLGSGDVTEQTPWNGEEIAYAIIQSGPGIPQTLDLRLQGVFMSRTNPPMKEEIDAANVAADKLATKLLGEANAYFAKGDLKEINEDHRWAAKRLGVDEAWNKRGVKQVDCPHCGGSMVSTAAVHFGVNGCGGVVDWKRAIASSLTTHEKWLAASSELPESQRHPDYKTPKREKTVSP